VRLTQDQAKSETLPKAGTGPIWNEAAVFDIKDETQPLLLYLMDSNNRPLVSSKIILQDDDIKEYRKMGQDIWMF